MPRGSNLEGKPGPGRPKGCPNKVTFELKEMIEKGTAEGRRGSVSGRAGTREPLGLSDAGGEATATGFAYFRERRR